MKVKDFSYLDVEGFMSQFMEIRIDYVGGDNPIYVGYNRTPNADVDASTWYIVKLTYSGSNLTRQQLGSLGVTFSYSWTNRATYFS